MTHLETAVLPAPCEHLELRRPEADLADQVRQEDAVQSGQQAPALRMERSPVSNLLALHHEDNKCQQQFQDTMHCFTDIIYTFSYNFAGVFILMNISKTIWNVCVLFNELW